MPRILCFIISLIYWSVTTNAQNTNQILGDEVDAIMQTEMAQNNIPGLAVSMVKDGEVVFKNAYGLAHIANNTPVTLSTEFTLASISKLFTATACVQLAENGLLDLDADINTYLPFTIINPNFPSTPITTRQLLQHKSSLRDFESDLQLWDAPGDPIYSMDYFCEEYFVPGGSLYVASNWNSNTAPGNSSYWYSNAGFTLLGFIVEGASGMPFNIYCANNIFGLLNMDECGWFYSEVLLSDVAMPYNGALVPYDYYSVPEYPAAMLKANIEELSSFLIAYTQNGMYNGNSLISQASKDLLVPASMTNGLGWWGMDTWYGDPNGDFWSHGGFMNGVRTQLNYYPDDETGLIILTNGQGNYNDIQNTLEDYIPQFQSCSGLSLEMDDLPSSVSSNTALSLNALPEGGTFSGPGVIFNAFNPSIAGPGFHNIEYTYDLGDGCVKSVSQNIIVVNITYNFVNYNLGIINPE